MKKYKKALIPLLLLLAIFLAFITRFYKLGSAPEGLYLDEAGQGFNALSLLKTGKDEFGMPFPVVFRSFIDFKTPIYIYLIVPLIPIFGLSVFAVRFPSFFFSVLTIPLLFLLINKLINFGKKRKNGSSLSAVVVLLLAISPWHVLFSRTNMECNMALFFFLLGTFLFYKGLKKPIWLIVSAISLSIAFPAYHAQRIVAPLMFILLFIRHKSILLSKSHKKIFISSLIIGFLLSIPSLKIMATPGFLARAGGLNIFTSSGGVPAGLLDNYSGIFGWIINHPIFLSTKEFFSLYISYLTPRNMFILGDYGPRSSYPEISTFFTWQFPFYIWGLYTFIKNKKYPELKFFTIAMLLISPLPAAVTRDPYSSIRSLQLVIPQTIIISWGILDIIKRIDKKLIGKLLIIISSVGVIIYSLLKLYSSGIILNEHYRAKYWHWGWEKVVDEFRNLDENLPMTVDNVRFEPYSQIVFFLNYDPETFRKDNFEVSNEEYYTNMDRVRDKKIGNITTRGINWEKDLRIEQYLIGDELAISLGQIEWHNLTLVKEILYPDKSVAYRIVKTNPIEK